MNVSHHRRLACGAGAAVAAAAGYWVPAAAVVSGPLRRLLGVRATIEREDAVALTFDDGPHPEGTPAVLAALERVGAPATFFLVGEQVERWPALAAEIVAAGHQVGVHCHRHRNLMRLTPTQVRNDLLHATELIASATGREPLHYRPPYGILTTPALAVARRMGWEVVLWRRDGHDWERRATADSIVERILHRLAPGDVVLLHDADHYSAPQSWRRTAAALDPLLSALMERGLTPESLSQPVAGRGGAV
ncbi:MAG: polysaccharide deacetylase family protein [Gaiellaceae bacterium]